MAPLKSEQQRKWGNSRAGHIALGDKGVEEYNKKTKSKKLPERVKRKKGKKK